MASLTRTFLCLCTGFLWSTAVAEEQTFSGVVHEVIDASLFGTDIEVGDTVRALLTLDTTSPNQSQDLFDFFDGISGEFTRYQWPSFLGFGNAGTFQVEVGDTSFTCNFIDVADVFVVNDFVSASNESFSEPTDMFIANGTDGISEFGTPPGDCVDFRFHLLLLDQSSNPLDGTFLQLPANQSVWDVEVWSIQARVLEPLPTGGFLLTWEPIIRGTIDEIGQTPEGSLQAFINDVTQSDLPTGLRTSILASLKNALAKVQSGNTTAAKNMLEALVNKLRAQSGKKIDADDAAEGIAGIREVIEAL